MIIIKKIFSLIPLFIISFLFLNQLFPILPSLSIGALQINASGSNITMSIVTSGASSRAVGEIITSKIIVMNTGDITGTTTFTDPIPPTPAGTTRNFSSAITLLASGNTPAGTGTITDSLVLPPGSTVTYIIDDTVTDIGTYQNSATSSASTPTIQSGQTVTIPGTTIPSPASITMSKVTSGATTRFVGDIITSTIVVTNTGGTTGTTTFTDPIPPTPAGTTRNFSSSITMLASGNTPAGTGTITDSLVLPPGATVTYVINDTVTDVGTYQNSATSSASTPTVQKGQTVTINPLAAIVNVTKLTAAGPYTVGVPIISTIDVTNTGNAIASGVLVIDQIPSTPAGTTRWFFSTQTGGANGNTVGPATTDVNDTVTLPAGATITYTISDTPTAVGTGVSGYQNFVTTNGPLTKPGGPKFDVGPSPNVAPQITKSTSGSVTRLVGDKIISIVTISNPAPAAIASTGILNITDAIPATPSGTTRTFTAVASGTPGSTGFTASGSGAINDNVTLPINGIITYTITDTVTAVGTYQNTATLTGHTPVTGNQVTITAPNLITTKVTTPGPYSIGSPILSTVTIQNTGSALGTTSVVDPIPASPVGTLRTFTSVSTGGATGATVTGTTGINDILVLPALIGKVVYTVIDIPTQAGTYQNLVTVAGKNPIPGTPDGILPPGGVLPSPGTVHAPNIVTTKTLPTHPYFVGSAITSVVTIKNIGDMDAMDVKVYDPIPTNPAGTTRTFSSIASGGATGNSLTGSSEINDILKLPIGSVVIYTVLDTPTTTGTYQNIVTISSPYNYLGSPKGGIKIPGTLTDSGWKVGDTFPAPKVVKVKTLSQTGTGFENLVYGIVLLIIGMVGRLKILIKRNYIN